MKISLIVFPLLNLCFIISSIHAQTSLSSVQNDLTKGTQKPLKITCKQSCNLYFSNYIINLSTVDNEAGQSIKVFNKSNQKIKTVDVVEMCVFSGIYKDYMILSCGTDVTRAVSIYDFKNRHNIEINEGVLGGPTQITNGILYMTVQMTDERVKKLKLKDQQCETMVCGYFEEVKFNLETRKIEYTGDYFWQE